LIKENRYDEGNELLPGEPEAVQGDGVPTTPQRLRSWVLSPQGLTVTGMALVSAAGPISNFLMASVIALPLKFGLVKFNDFIPLRNWSFGNYLALLLFYVVVINVVLGIFNLIPIAPLDGAKIAGGILPGELGDLFRRLEPYGPGILMVMFALSWLSPRYSIFAAVINPLENRILRGLVG